MLSFINRLRDLMFGLLSNIIFWIHWSRYNLQNFIAFSIGLACINFLVRLIIFHFVLNAVTALWLSRVVAILCFATFLKILFFYVRDRYGSDIERFLCSNIIDLERVRENRSRRNQYLMLLRERETLSYWLITFYPLGIFFLLLLQQFNDVISPWLNICYCVILMYYTIWQYRFPKLKFQEISQSERIALRHIRSRFSLRRNLIIVKIIGFLQGIFYGTGVTPNSSMPSLPPISTTPESSSETHTPQRGSSSSTSSSARWFRRASSVSKTGLLAGLVGVTSLFAAGASTLNSIVSASNSHYEAKGEVSPYVAKSFLYTHGYTTYSKRTLDQVNELRDRGCEIETFVNPRTRILDSAAVQNAIDRVQYDVSSGRFPGHSGVPLPKGPYSPDRLLNRTDRSHDFDCNMLKATEPDSLYLFHE